jgi:pimeloyl-ACP methyl ester carboxylesterase
MLKRFMHKREKYFAMLNDNRIVHPFGWGTEFIKENPNGDDPRKLFSEYSKRMVENSDEFYHLPAITDYSVRDTQFVIRNSEEKKKTNNESRKTYYDITWTSAIKTPSIENNTAYATFFPHEKDKKAAVVVLPHWNAKAGTYFDLCKFFNKVGVSALRLTLPYHEERMPPELERADYLVAPNVGRTLQSLRQSVLDTKAAVRWLKQQGYEKVGVVGTSIGSCVGFFAFVHDETIDAGVFNHVSGYVADVVWNGLSTYHVKEGLQNDVTLEELREYWMPISPMAYMDKLAKLKPRPQRYIYTLYDLTFPIDLSRQMMNELRKTNVEHDEVVIPCGHYTLGEKPWIYLDGYKIISFLRKHLR